MKQLTSKWRMFLIVACLIVSSLCSMAQNKTVTINLKNATLEELFSSIEKQTSYRFSYRNVVIDTKKDVTISKSNVTVESVLKDALASKNLDFSIVSDKSIVIVDKKKSEIVVQNEPRKISGKIVDDKGIPMAGVTINVKESNIVMFSDGNGDYVITVPADKNTLGFSYIGFNKVEKTIGNASVIDVELVEDTKTMNEVIVVAYGTAKKGGFTGSASSINTKALETRPITNIGKALEGIAPGLQTSSGTGQPGAGVTMRVRGIGSINASSSPLIILDGFPYNGSLSDIGTEEIENITLLKDAASTALYGNRASNGVIVISTKKGKNGKVSLNAKVVQSVSSRGIPEYDRLDAYQFVPIVWETMRNNQLSLGKTLEFANDFATTNIVASGANGGTKVNPFNVADNEVMQNDGTINPLAKLLYSDDWKDAVTQLGVRSDYSIAASGGTEKSDFFISLGYLDDKGYTIKSDYNRINARASGNLQVKKWLKIGTNLSAIVSKTNSASTGGSSNTFYITRMISPLEGIYMHDPKTGEILYSEYDGSVLYNYRSSSNFNAGRNVVAETLWNMSNSKKDGFTAKGYAEINLIDNLKFTINSGLESSNTNSKIYYNKFIGDGAGVGKLSMSTSKATIWNHNQLLTYNKTIADKHNFDVLVGHESWAYTYNYLWVQRSRPKVDGMMELSNFVETDEPTSYENNRRIEGYLSRLNYDYDNRFYASLSFRRDGSSKFYKDARWGNFWSVGAGWRIDEEKFFDVSWIESLKLRASYGILGNDEGVDNYAWQDLFDSDKKTNNGLEGGIWQSVVVGNKLLKWETSTTFDVGVDFSLFNGKLSGSIEYFNKNTKDLLYKVKQPQSSGVEAQWGNVASMYNRGFEFELSGYLVNKNDFSWSSKLNLTSVVNKVSKLPQDVPPTGTQKISVGHSIYDYWLQTYEGVNPTNGEAMYTVDEQYIAQQDEGKIKDAYYMTEDGRAVTNQVKYAKYSYQGSALPKLFGGFSNTFDYKNLSLSFLFTFQMGGKIYDSNYQSLMSSSSYSTSLHVDILNRWQQEGDITNVPRMDAGKSTDFNANSSRWLFDASYLSLKSVSLSYKLPKKFVKALDLSNISLFASAENLFILSSLKGMNPSQTISGVTSNTYDPSRTFSIGLNIAF